MTHLQQIARRNLQPGIRRSTPAAVAPGGSPLHISGVRPSPPTIPANSRETLQLALGAGLALAVLFTSQLYIWVNWWPLTIGWGTAALWALPQLAVWIGEIGVVIALARRWPVEPPRRNRKVLLHAALSLLFALGGLWLLDVSDQLVGWSVGLGAPSSLISSLKYTIIHLHIGIGVYWVTLAVTQAVSYRGDLRVQQAQLGTLAGELAEARLAALRMQLQPHFLFNTLNSIAVAIRNEPHTAERMVHRLGDFLRLTLEASDIPEITLDEELEALEAYLAIEQARFGDHLLLQIRAPAETRICLVPTLVLQPLVENAIRHAITTRAEGGLISVEASRVNERLILTVRDDGPGIGATPREGGVGVSNTRRRLETHYGDRARFTLSSRAEGGAEARLELPAREGGLAEEGTV